MTRGSQKSKTLETREKRVEECKGKYNSNKNTLTERNKLK